MKETVPISISEAFFYLQNARPRIISKDSESRKILDNTLEYCQTNLKINNLSALQNISENLKSFDLNEFEIVQILNIFPQSIEEMKVLVPSLDRFDELVLGKILTRINSVQDI